MACETISSFSAATLSNTYYDSNGNPVAVTANTPLKKDNEVHRMLIRHLYRRIGYGASLADIEYIHDNNKTLGAIVNELINNSMTTSLPQEFDWSVRSPLNPIYKLSTDPTKPDTRLPSRMAAFMLSNYWINECITESVKSKLLMFWHSHFAIKIDDYNAAPAVLQYFEILFDNAFGGFKELVKKIGRTPMMLVFLSGFDSSGEPTGDYTNSSKEPNENYARELLELFTMGIKDKNGADNYTEDDIEAIARALSGWRVYRDSLPIGWGLSEAGMAERLDANKFGFQYKYHDWGEKTFFGNTYNALTEYWTPRVPGTLPQNTAGNEYVRAIAVPDDGTLDGDYVGAGTAEYNRIHDIIFVEKQQEIAYFICKKLYQFYVYADTENSNLDQSGVDAYISSLATAFINNNWSIEIVLKRIFKSQHFYDAGIMGTQIKSHIGSSVSLFRSTALQPVNDYEYRLTLLTSDKAGPSPKLKSDGTFNPNYNGNNPDPSSSYFYYSNNDGQINIMTGEGAPMEWAAEANQYFFNAQMTWKIKNQSAKIGQDLFLPPSVEGWPGHRDWINEYTLVKRQELLLCALDRFSLTTKEKFRQLAEDLLVLKYGTAPVYESDPVYGGNDGLSSQFDNPEKLVRVLWKHFFSVEPEEKNIDGTMIGQVIDAVGVYVDGWDAQTYGPSPNIKVASEETAQRVTNILKYFVRQPEFHLT